MAKKTLIIVESPAKAKTIEKYLGEGYAVAASMGHLVDLPKSRLAVDVEKGFEPEYITIRGKAKILNGLRQEAGRSAEVLLASDNDREGEAISFHLRNAILLEEARDPDPQDRVQRDHPAGHPRRGGPPGGDRRGQGGRAEGPPGPGPPGRLQPFARSSGRRSRTGCPPAGCSRWPCACLRPGGGGGVLPPRGVLEPGGGADRRAARPSRPRCVEFRGAKAELKSQKGGGRRHRRPAGRRVPGGRPAQHREDPEAQGPPDHLQAAAGGGQPLRLHLAEDHAGGPDPVRGRGHRLRPGGPDHLHAHGLHPRVGNGAGRGARLSGRALPRGAARKGRVLHARRQGAGRPRSHPPDLRAQHPGGRPRRAQPRAVQAVLPHLGALRILAR